MSKKFLKRFCYRCGRYKWAWQFNKSWRGSYAYCRKCQKELANERRTKEGLLTVNRHRWNDGKLLAYLLAFLVKNESEGYMYWNFKFNPMHVIVSVTVFDDLKKEVKDEQETKHG